MLHNAEVAGICSIKYFDLKQNRVQNYKFEYDKILDPKGDSGCYLLYMYARIISIFNKGGYTEQSIKELAQTQSIKITSPQERDLAIMILRLPETIDGVFFDLQLNKICKQLYDVAGCIGSCYRANKVLGSDEEKSRILILEAT